MFLEKSSEVGKHLSLIDGEKMHVVGRKDGTIIYRDPAIGEEYFGKDILISESARDARAYLTLFKNSKSPYEVPYFNPWFVKVYTGPIENANTAEAKINNATRK